MTNDPREQRGLVIAATAKLTKKGGVWLVPSQSGKGKYTVCPDKEHPHCSCPDHETTGCKCKHIFAVEFVIQRELFPDGSVIETRQLTLTETRKTYRQDWQAYNEAQTTEKAQFQNLLHQLCKGIQGPQAIGRSRGRPRIPLDDAIFAACFKVYSTVSSRRFTSDLQDACDKGYIRRCPHFNSVLNVFDDPETFPILRALVEQSATPLKSLESHFSCDSSGFSGCRFDRWLEQKYGPLMKKVQRTWVKAHIMSGAKTNVVCAVEIFDQHANDGVQLPRLLATTARTFTIQELSADLAYSTHTNLEAVDALGATTLIPFKTNASAVSGGLWAKMFHYFQLHREEFLSRYHQRSNVETAFSMIKKKHGDSVRSKNPLAMKNEVLAKLVCHNICCVIQSACEFGIDPAFWSAA